MELLDCFLITDVGILQCLRLKTKLKVSRQGWLKFCHPAQTGSHADVQYSVLFLRNSIINHEEYVKKFLECIKNAIENIMNCVKIVKEKVSKD